MEIMEVEEQDPSSVAVVETFLHHMKSPPSPAMSTCSQNSRSRGKTQSFNRSNVHIEDFILKQPEDINAKAMRVLIPAMFQKLKHPDKETTKTKVKGLWEPGNKPEDLPLDVDFKDPNNIKKMSNDMMKKFFVYLKANLLKNHPEYRTSKAVQTAPITTPYLEQQNTSYTTSVKSPLPNLGLFQVLSKEHDARTSFVPQHVENVVKSEFGEMTEEVMSTSVPVIPETVEQISSAKYLAAYNEFCVDAKDVEQHDVPGYTWSQQEQMLSPQPPQCVNICQDDQGNVTTEYVIMHQMQPMEIPHTITTVENDGLTQPVIPQDTPVGPTYPDSTQNSECAKFVEDMRAELRPYLDKFESTFTEKPDVIQYTYSILEDLLQPMMQSIAQNGDKQKALELSQFCATFQDILRTASLFGQDYNPSERLRQLREKYDTVCSTNVIPESCVPPVDNEVQVYHVSRDDVLPKSNSQDYYIPTIEDLKSHSFEKFNTTDEPMDASWQNKVLVEKNPFPEDFSFETMDMDPENDFGIQLKRTDSFLDTEDSSVELQEARNENEAIASTIGSIIQHNEFLDVPDMMDMYSVGQSLLIDNNIQLASDTIKQDFMPFEQKVSVQPKVLDRRNEVVRLAPQIPTTVFDAAESTGDDGLKARRRPKGMNRDVSTLHNKGYKKRQTYGKGQQM